VEKRGGNTKGASIMLQEANQGSERRQRRWRLVINLAQVTEFDTAFFCSTQEREVWKWQGK